MKVLAIRCSNNDYTYCVMSGTKDSPNVDVNDRVAFPRGFSTPEALRWFHHEIQGLLNSHSPDRVVIKGAEPMVKRSNTLESRMHNEAIIFLCCSQTGCEMVEKKVKATIAKDLGLKGRAKYLASKLDTSVIPNFDERSVKEQEAILAGWSCLD